MGRKKISIPNENTVRFKTTQVSKEAAYLSFSIDILSPNGPRNDEITLIKISEYLHALPCDFNANAEAIVDVASEHIDVVPSGMSQEAHSPTYRPLPPAVSTLTGTEHGSRFGTPVLGYVS